MQYEGLIASAQVAACPLIADYFADISTMLYLGLYAVYAGIVNFGERQVGELYMVRKFKRKEWKMVANCTRSSDLQIFSQPFSS